MIGKVYLVLVEYNIPDVVRVFLRHPEYQAFAKRADAEALAASLQHPGCPVETEILELAIVPASKRAISNSVPTRGGVWKDKGGVLWRLNQRVPGNEPIMKDTHLLAIIKWAQRQWHDPGTHQRYHSRTMGTYLSFPEPQGEMAQLAFEQELDQWLAPWDGTYYPIEAVFDNFQIPYRELVAEAHARRLNVPPLTPANSNPDFLPDRC